MFRTKPQLWKRAIRLWWQRRTRGWDDSETWSLDHVIAEFALPRLRRFKELNNGIPHGFTERSWDACIDDMIYALEVVELELDGPQLDADWERVERGLEAFGKHFRSLWW